MSARVYDGKLSKAESDFEAGKLLGHLNGKEMTKSAGLPRSTRNVPPELRAAIRRKQNNESAKRCRQRENAELDEMEMKYLQNKARIDILERQVEELAAELTTPKVSRRKKLSVSRGVYYGDSSWRKVRHVHASVSMLHSVSKVNVPIPRYNDRVSVSDWA